jgi:hypothetical protein
MSAQETSMATLTDQIDHFVRWFFDSSPDVLPIEPRSQSKPAKSSPPAPGKVVKRKPTQGMRRRSPLASKLAHDTRVGA